MKRCIYCNLEKQEKEFNIEHIFPDALGGNLCGDSLKTDRVCRKCNSLMGIFVDGAFIKSWFAKNLEADAARHYLDLERPSIVPFNYQGRLQDITSHDGDICELWLGPCGDSIYHFHKEDHERFYTYAGGDPIARKRDPGYAFFFLATEDHDWIRTILASFKHHFKSAKRYPANVRIGDNQLHNQLFHSIPKSRLELLESLKTVRKKGHDCRLHFTPDIEKRLMCKMAIGMGYNLFGDSYLDTEYYSELRRALWNFGKKEKSTFKIRGSGSIFDEKSPDTDILAWEGGHTIVIMPTKQDCFLSVYLYGKIAFRIVIADKPSLWENSDLSSDEGRVFVIVPQVNRGVGPLSIGEFLAHRFPIDDELDRPYQGTRIKELEELEALRTDISSHRPCRDKKESAARG